MKKNLPKQEEQEEKERNEMLVTLSNNNAFDGWRTWLASKHAVRQPRMELGEYDTIKRRTKPYTGKERLIGAINRGCDCKRCGTMSGDGVSSDNLVYSWWLANVNETRNDSYMVKKMRARRR
ncbi:hypothetical protein LR48_Vigan10g055300 [Vigna angularis]|uniref:Uncharacterized protein n=1 Tax=Phaseolus angularis TaxID=3914 RepID=A0A0L9VHX7_PHAAN|nr:hypothetical protein LR48_Vigan10g055300 [Vigna angularis]